MIARSVFVLLVAGLLGFQVVRTAAVRLSPHGTWLWAGHPGPRLNQTMAEIGALAARGQSLPPPVLQRVGEVARKMPLAPEPFLIKGALAQLERRDGDAERLYLEARGRDPRSRAARYFLAERFLRNGRIGPALGEMGVLSQLTGGAGLFAPGLAAYARTPGAVAQLRRFFRSSPEFEPVVLSHLASDAKNLDLILALWSRRAPTAAAAPPEWQAQIVGKLVEQGDFHKAHGAWRRFAGIERAPTGLFNPQFRDLAAPAPFNWTFGSAGGLADPTADGRLEVIYFGRDDAMLAQQLLLLSPGRYRLSMQASGDLENAVGIGWSLECLPKNQPVMRLLLAQRRAPARLEATFAVPPGCPAQRLQLAGSPGEFPKATEFTLGSLQLTRMPGK